MPSDVVDDVVVGAGVVGLTTALLLARGGHDVVVVTAEPVGGGSSGRSLGIVSELHGTAYRRTRQEHGHRIQRAEVRFDGIAGCLRTPGGGSSRTASTST